MEPESMEEDDVPVRNGTGPRPANIFTRKLSRRAASVRSTVSDAYLDEDDEFDHLRVQVSATVRNLFENEVEINSLSEPKCRLVKQFIQFYRKIKKEQPVRFLSIVIDELRLRLNHIVEETSQYESRYRVLVFFVICALRLFYDHNETDLLQLMLDYAIVYANAESPTVRANCLRVCGRMLKHWMVEPVGKDKTKHIAPDTRDQIYANLRDRQLDKAVLVRHFCVLAIAEIQEMAISNDFRLAVETSPKDMMFMACQDLAPQVQLAAITTVDLSNCSEYHLDKLANFACGAPNIPLQQEAIKRLGKIHLERFNKEKLRYLLLTTLKEHPDVQEAAKRHMLMEWMVKLALGVSRQNGFPTGRRNDGDEKSGEQLLAVGSSVICFLNQMECKKWDNDTDTIVFGMLDCARWAVRPNRKLNIAELATYLATDPCKPKIWTRANKDAVFKENVAYESVATQMYLWRCAVQYCHDRSPPGSSEDAVVMRDECFQRLLCPLTVMVDILEATYKREELHTYEEEGLPLSEEDQYHYMRSIAEAIKLCNFATLDPHGAKKYMDLLTEIALNTTTHTMVTDVIGLTLANLLHRETDEKGAPPRCECQQYLEMFLQRAKLFAAMDKEVDENTTDPPMNKHQRIKLMGHAIQVLHGMMRNNQIHTDTPFMRHILERMMGNAEIKENDTARGILIKIVTIAMMGSEKFGRTHFSWLQRCFTTEASKNKAIAANCQFDLAHHYGIAKFDRWRSQESISKVMPWAELIGGILYTYNKNHKLDPQLHGKGEEYLTDEECFKATCEVACKYILNDCNDPDPQVDSGIIAGLCSQYFRVDGLKCPRFRQMFLQFVFIFIQQSRLNMTRFYVGIITVIKKMLKEYSNKSGNKTNVSIADIEVIVTAAACWCREDLLHPEGEKTELDPQYRERYEINFVFLTFFLTYVPVYINHQGLTDLFLRVIAAQDPTRIPEVYLQVILEQLIQAFEAIDEHYEPDHEYRRILNRVQEDLDKHFVPRDVKKEQEVDDEHSDTAKSTKKRVNPTPTKNTRRFFSVQRYRVIRKGVVFEEDGLNPGPEGAPSSSRAHLARAARLRRQLFDLETVPE